MDVVPAAILLIANVGKPFFLFTVFNPNTFTIVIFCRERESMPSRNVCR